MTAGAETTCEELTSRTWFSWTNHPGITSTGFPSGDYVNPRSPEPQGDCGTCGMFGLVEAAEIQYKIANGIPNFAWVVNFSEWGVISAFYAAINSNLVAQNYLCQDAAANPFQMSTQLISAGTPYIFGENLIPYPIVRTTRIAPARRFYPQLADMKNKFENIQDFPRVVLEGALIIKSEETVDGTTFFDNTALITQDIVDQAKLALTCGLTLGAEHFPAGPLTAAVTSNTPVMTWDIHTQSYTYQDKTYSPGDRVDNAGHQIVIVGWVNRLAQDVNINGTLLDWEDIWDIVEQTILLGRTDNPSFSLPYLTHADLEAAVGGVFVIIDNHDNQLYFAPYFLHADLVGDLDQFRFIQSARLEKFDFQYYSDPGDNVDLDAIPDLADNCPDTANSDQKDLDRDGFGDVCDEDVDGDGIPNGSDKDSTNPELATDLNKNDKFEKSSVYQSETTDSTAINSATSPPTVLNNITHRYRHSAYGYFIDWTPMTIYNTADATSLGPDIGECEDACFNPNDPLCIQRCQELDLDLEFLDDIDKLRLPGRESFACKYQNYFHPLCLKWVEFLLNLKAAGFWPTATLETIDAEMQDLSDAVATLIDLGNYFPGNAAASYRDFTLAGFQSWVNAFASGSDQDVFALNNPQIIDLMIFNYPFNFQPIHLPDELKRYNPCDLLHQTLLTNFVGLPWWQEPAAGPYYNTEGNEGDPWWVDTSGAEDHYGEFREWLGIEIEPVCPDVFKQPQLLRSIQLTTSAVIGSISSGSMEGIHACITPTVVTNNQPRRVFDETLNSWVLVNEDDLARVGLCACVGPCDEYQWQETYCTTINEGDPAPALEDSHMDYSTNPPFRNQNFDPLHATQCSTWATESRPTSLYRPYKAYCTNKSYPTGLQALHQKPGEFHDLDLAIRKRELPWNHPLIGASGQLWARYSVRQPGTTDWDESYRSALNHTTAAIPVGPVMDCVTLYWVNNWISNHNLRMIPEVALGLNGRPTWFLWTGSRDHQLLMQMDADQTTVRNLHVFPNGYAGGGLLSDGASYDSATFLFAQKGTLFYNKLVRAQWSPTGWTYTQLKLSGTTPALQDVMMVPYDTNHWLMAGKNGTSVRIYRVMLSSNNVTVTQLASVSGFSRVVATRMGDRGPLLALSGATEMRFIQYNGTELINVWTASTSQLVESIAYTGEQLLMKLMGNQQVYKVDPWNQIKADFGDPLPSGANHFTLLPNRLNMVLGVGERVAVKAYQNIEDEWMTWQTFVPAQ